MTFRSTWDQCLGMTVQMMCYVLVLESDSVPLLGMTLLWGSRVTLDASTGGEVAIEELPPT